MRRTNALSALTIPALAALASIVGACVHEDRRGPVQPSVYEGSRPAEPEVPLQYVVADPLAPRAGAIVVPLGALGAYGFVLDKRRIVVGQGEPRVAADLTSEPLVGATRLAGRFGSGFLFWTANTIYRADAFDNRLAPIAQLPDVIEAVSFAPKSLLVRTHSGERWGIALPSGDRAPILPLGAADVQALDDGRAISFNDQGAVFTSVDNGEHWSDVTAQVKSSPTKVSIVGNDLWLLDTNGTASRLERDGRLAWFDKAPQEATPEVRPKDPRWHGEGAPLRAAFHFGAAVDERTAIVIEGGDIVKIDLRSGEVVGALAGQLPPDAQCEAVPASGDVIFACASKLPNGGAFVVSHTLSSSPPVVEHTFGAVAPFFASDDGGIAYGGPCGAIPPSTPTPGQPPPTPSVCVRTPGGNWEEHDVSGMTADGGAADLNVTRWVPRYDGHVVAILAEPNAGVYDPTNGTFLTIPKETAELIGRSAPYMPAMFGKAARMKMRRAGVAGPLVDSSWSLGPNGALRGWQQHGESLEIAEDGRVTRSPFAFDVIYAGANGIGRSKDGRLYQSNDHGASWVEVASPPAGTEAGDLVSCTSAGCDLGAFYRLGWIARPPRAAIEQTPAPPAPMVRHVRGLELTCRPSGAVVSRVLPRTQSSPEDLGLGAARLQVPNEHSEWSFVRNVVVRSIVSPVRDAAGLVGEGDNLPSLRAAFTGFATSRDGDVFTVMGPNKNGLSLRRGFSYSVPFDPSGRIVRTNIAVTDVVAAGRRAGMTTDEILSEDPTENGNVISITPADPSAPTDVAVHNAERGFLSIVRGERVRVIARPAQNQASVVSGVALSNTSDDLAFLELDGAAAGRVFKVTSGTVSDLFEVNPTANDTYYPANPDALAVGQKGELAILRTPSGSEPASALDPAFLIVQASPPQPLAPWSEVKLADDPACKAERGGYRATLQTLGPWVRVANPELRVEDLPMFARVRWTPKRVCLEGFEVRLPNVTVRASGAVNDPILFATWLVARGSTFARVGIAEGVEWRQSLDCTIVGAGP
jgi:hypothetical protein